MDVPAFDMGYSEGANAPAFDRCRRRLTSGDAIDRSFVGVVVGRAGVVRFVVGIGVWDERLAGLDCHRPGRSTARDGSLRHLASTRVGQ